MTGVQTCALPIYVYQELPFDYPVMAAVADCRQAIDRLRETVDDAMAASAPDRERVE